VIEQTIFSFSVVKDGKKCLIGHSDGYATAIVTLNFNDDDIDDYENGLNAVVCPFDKLDIAIKNVLSLIN